MRLALLGVLSLLAFPSFAGLDERIQVAIEEPVQGERYSGISNLRGWAVSPEGTGNFYHQVFIDGDFAFYMSAYGNRTDVGNAFPDYPDSDTAGFSMAFNYKDLAPGEHEIKVRAFDNASNYNEAVTTFTTERFDSTFIASDSDVDLSGLDNVFLYDDQALLLNGANVEGKRWNFLLKWDKPSQSFKIWGIEGYAGDLSYSTGYEIAGSDSSASAYAADCDPAVGFGCSDSSGSSTTSTGSGSGSSGSSTTSTGSDTGFPGPGSSSSDDSGSDTADCDPAVDFGCQHGGTTGSDSSDSTATFDDCAGYNPNCSDSSGSGENSSDSSDSTGATDGCANVTGYNPNCSDSSASSSGSGENSSDSSDSTGTTDDCANATGYNPNCSDSSGSGGSTSSSGSPSDSSGSGGSGSSSGSSSDASGGGCYSSDNRCVQVYPSSVDLGNSTFSSGFQVTIEERTVAVVGLSIEPSFYQAGWINFAIDVGEGWFYSDELVIWISETPDGASVSDSCRYKGFFEGAISFRLDGSGSCSLSTGKYFVNFAVCSSDPEDWACSFGAVMNSQDLEMRLRRRYL